jgi:hypothetical protein
VTRQPNYFKTAGDKIISSATDITNHFNYYFTTVSDVIKDSFGFINITPNFDKLTQYVDSRLPPNASRLPPNLQNTTDINRCSY